MGKENKDIHESSEAGNLEEYKQALQDAETLVDVAQIYMDSRQTMQIDPTDKWDASKKRVQELYADRNLSDFDAELVLRGVIEKAFYNYLESLGK